MTEFEHLKNKQETQTAETNNEKKAEPKAEPKPEPKAEPKTEPKPDEPNDTNKNNNEVKTPKYVLVNKEGVRERRKPLPNRHEENPEPIDQSLFDVIGNNITKIYNAFPQQIKFWLIIAVIIYALYYTVLPGGKSSAFFQKFAGTTNSVFEEINGVDLPASNSIMQHTVSCRNVANMIQRSPAFESHGSQIASGLREFGEKITIAGRQLQKMYNKGSSVYKSFDIEIEEMKNRLNSARKRGDTKFFKDRINKLITNIREFRNAVDKTQTSIHNAEAIRHDTEGYILDGLREAEKFIDNNEHNSQHAVDLVKAKKELTFVNNVLDHLNNTAVHLDKIQKILMNYEDKLMDVSAALNNPDDNGFEVTKTDLKYLKNAVDNSKACLYKFNQLAG